MENVFKGTGTALITPFREKDHSIDFDALDRLLDLQFEGGVDFLVSLGTTAETVTMEHAERHEVYNFIKRKNNKRKPMMVGFGGNCTAEVINHIKSADLKDIDAILSVVPYYNKPTQEGIYRHFMAIAEVSPVPIVLYNIPSRCGVNMTAETTLRLINSSDRFMAIKEASGNMEQIKTLIERVPKNFGVISGDDSLIYDINSNGGSGIISVLSNAFPKLTVELTQKSFINAPDACQLQQSLKKLISLLFVEGNPCGIKAALHHMGYLDNALRLPLCPVSEKTYNEIVESIQPYI